MAGAGTGCSLYLLTPPVIPDLAGFCDALAAVLAAADVAAIQVRLKTSPEAEIGEAVKRIQPLAASARAAVILNDRPDLAALWECDGAHIGADDGTAEDARRVLGPDRILGVSCGASRHRAMEAAEAGADYVAFGAFFATSTKAAVEHPEPEILAIWRETMQTPCVAIGGITAANCAPLIRAGADFLAVCSGVWDDPAGPASAAAAIQRQIATFSGAAGPGLPT